MGNQTSDRAASPTGSTGEQERIAAVADLVLSAAEAEVLVGEAAAFSRTLRDPESRRRYGELAEAAGQGAAPAHLVGSLEAMLELVLQTQRLRRVYGPEAEEALAALFYRTPRGAALKQAARGVNRALEALRGQRLEKLSVVSGPGRHTLLIDTDCCHLTLRLDRAGARVQSLEVG